MKTPNILRLTIASSAAILFAVSASPPASVAQTATLDAQKIQGPVPGTVMTPGYAKTVAQMAYVWGWPLVNLHNRRLMYSQVPAKGLLGPMPVAPVNELAMLADYIDPNIRVVAHPNQDVVYGFGMLALDKEPVVVQIPDFGDRYWMYEVADQRTDSFAEAAKIYGTMPGFYLVVGPNWNGSKPKGIAAIWRSPTDTGVVIPRVFMADTAEDRAAIQPVLGQIMMYPLSKFTGKMQTIDWKNLPKLPMPKSDASSSKDGGETPWVHPDNFFKQLGQVLDEVPPLPGEESLYGQFRALLATATADPAISKVLQQTARDSEEQIVDPLFFLSNVGVRIAHHWTRPLNNAAFGTDYLTRLAVSKSNIFTNNKRETSYLYQYLDGDGNRLTGRNAYTLTFPAGQTPPATGFWSLTMYDKKHFFVPNEIKRFSTGTKNTELKYNPDGSLTIYIQHEKPASDKIGNWLPAPEDEFAMTIRAYGPKVDLIEGKWSPPAVKVQ
jgi:hypothetical protein